MPTLFLLQCLSRIALGDRSRRGTSSDDCFFLAVTRRPDYADERIASRNALAAEIVADQKIPTIDLNAAVRGHPELHSDNVHFSGQGSQILTAQPFEVISKFLSD